MEPGKPSSGKEVDPRMHSAEHVLTATLIKLFGCDRPFTTHIEKKKSKADYRFDHELTPEDMKRVENAVNEVIQSDLPVREKFLSREEAEQIYNLEQLPAGSGDSVRIVCIGEYDACPCIGPHVKSTREIGTFRIVSTTCESGTLRVRFKPEASG
jgi:Ser-tRNA(Ala) deacylase AlaX